MVSSGPGEKERHVGRGGEAVWQNLLQGEVRCAEYTQAARDAFFQARMAKCSIWYYTKWYSAVPREVPSPFRHVVMPTCLLFEERLPHGEQSCSIKRARSLR